MKKTVLAFLLIISMLTSVIPAYAKDGVTWNIKNSVLTVSGKGAMEDYISSEKCPWSNRKNEIKEIVISYGITSVGDWSFADCENATSLKIADSVIRIGKRAFYNCKSLPAVKVGNGVKYIGDGAFNSCIKATRVDLPKTLISIGSSCFMNMQNITAVMIPENVSYIGDWAFFGNLNMKGLYFFGNVTKNMGRQIIGNIREDYEIFFSYRYVNEWVHEKLFDEEHEYVFESNGFIPVYMNNSFMCLEYDAVAQNGRVLVPVRSIFEAMGVDVEWEPQTQTVVTEKGDISVKIPINSNVIYKNTQAIQIDVPATVIGNVTYIPIRAVAQAYGASVSWNVNEKSVNINYNFE